MREIRICSICNAPLDTCVCQLETGFNPKAKPRWRSKEYLKFVRSLPCCVEGCTNQSEAAHFGRRGIGTKTHDCLAIPLCRQHHMDSHNETGEWRFHNLIPYWQIRTMTAFILENH